MAKILLSLADENQAERAAKALAGGRHELVRRADLRREGLAEAAIVEERAEVVILDYWPEDAASVKLMQTVSDLEDCPSFIFIENSGQTVDREDLHMVLNEGAQAFLPASFQAAALSNYVERAVKGPGRLRPRAQGRQHPDEALKRLEEALGQARTRSLGFQKVIAHLLSTPPGAQNRKVLVVSDSPYQLEMLKKILEDHNFRVSTATNPADGLNVALSESPRLIISDLELEGQTGLELCQAVKFTHKLIPCFFVICTANQDKISLVMSPGNGVDDCLLKPSGPHDTIEFIARAALGLLLPEPPRP